MILIAIIIPWLSFFLRGKLLSGLICLILQVTLIGWIPAVAWAVISLNNDRANNRVNKIVRAIKKSRQ